MLVWMAWSSIGIALLCAVWIVVDEIRRPQTMAIMNLVWPLTALYGGVFAVWAYWTLGRPRRKENRDGITAGQVAVSTSHCGAGCALADLMTAFVVAASGITFFGETLWAEYAIGLAAAWALGVVFQYGAIKPMREISAGAALIAAIKADTLSIVAFQLGMYGWMAVVYFAIFPRHHLTPFEPVYWMMMQVAMVFGFATSFPMNWWLVKRGWKEAM